MREFTTPNHISKTKPFGGLRHQMHPFKISIKNKQTKRYNELLKSVKCTEIQVEF